MLTLDFCVLGLAPIWSSDQQSSEGHNDHPLLILQRAAQEAALKEDTKFGQTDTWELDDSNLPWSVKKTLNQ